MLVFARKCTQQITFPDYHIRVEVLAVKPGVVRLGVEAPPEVRVLRGELPDRVAEWGPEPAAAPVEGPPRQGQLERLTRSGLALASVGVGLARLQAAAGLTEDLRQTLDQIHEQLQWLRDQWEPARPAPLSEPEALCEVGS
jgi:carbon storage regulator CsrA